MARATRTINPLHFEDLEPHRFEDLVRQLAYSFRPWRSLEATGRLGGDKGVDIRGWEMVGGREDTEGSDPDADAASDREWRIQVKREKRLGPADLKAIVEDEVPTDGPPPYGLVVAAACNVSADALAALRAASMDRGVVETHMWSNAHLEDALFLPEHDHLLFAYFGISITTKRRAQLAELRAILALKRKIRAVIDKDGDKTRGLRQALVVRDIDAPYPDFENVRGGRMRSYAPPWHAVTLKEIHPQGPIVERFHYEGIVKEDGTWDILEDEGWWPTSARGYSNDFPEDDDPTKRRFFGGPDGHPESKTVTEIRLIPWENIVEVDPGGDSHLPDPHLICRFEGEEGPYEGRRVYRAYVGGSDKALPLSDRRPLFPREATAEAAAGPKATARKPRKRTVAS